MYYLARSVLLVVGTAYGVVMLAGYFVMLPAAAGGWMPVNELTVPQVALGVLMVTLWGGVILAGLRALVQQGRQKVSLARWVAGSGVAASPRLATAAVRAGFAAPLVEVPDASPYAFTYGIWRPRVVVSAGLAEAASNAELVAVLRHEGSHVRNRDPLKVLALRTWAAAFFLIPLVGAVFQRVLDRQELRADRAALRDCGISPVAGALLKAVGEPAAASRNTALAAIGGPALLDARVAQLETGRNLRLLTAIHPRALLASLPGIGLISFYGVLLYQVCVSVELCCMS